MKGFTFVEVMVVMVIIAVIALTVVGTIKKNSTPNSNRVTATTNSLPGSGYSESGTINLVVTSDNHLKVMTVVNKLKAAMQLATDPGDSVVVRW